MAASRIIVIDDEFSVIRPLQQRHAALRRERAIVDLETWTTAEAADRLGTERWTGDEYVLMDCWDRNAVDRPGGFGTTFYAIDLLTSLRTLQESGAVVPRAVAYSRAMGDELVRATLGEFTARRVQVAVDRSRGVVRGWRLDLGAGAGGGVLWAMFDHHVLQERLYEIALGDRKGSLARPAASSTVWDEFLPSSCLASFHNALRDTYPDIWAERVIGPQTTGRVDEPARTGIRRIGLRYLEPNPARRQPTCQGYLAIARQMADPLWPRS